MIFTKYIDSSMRVVKLTDTFYVFRLQTRQWSDSTIRKEVRTKYVRGGRVNKTVDVVVTPRVR